jgi:hypothetical protein
MRQSQCKWSHNLKLKSNKASENKASENEGVLGGFEKGMIDERNKRARSARTNKKIVLLASQRLEAMFIDRFSFR